MSDLRAAAERLLDQSKRYSYEYRNFDQGSDEALLARWAAPVILATHAADDGEAIDADWLESEVGRLKEDNEFFGFDKIVIDSGNNGPWRAWLYCGSISDMRMICTITTRGQLRRLVAALG